MEVIVQSGNTVLLSNCSLTWGMTNKIFLLAFASNQCWLLQVKCTAKTSFSLIFIHWSKKWKQTRFLPSCAAADIYHDVKQCRTLYILIPDQESSFAQGLHPYLHSPLHDYCQICEEKALEGQKSQHRGILWFPSIRTALHFHQVVWEMMVFFFLGASTAPV